MKKRQFNKISLICCVAALFASTGVLAADLAAANTIVADIGVKVTQANAELAAVAASTNSSLSEVADVQKSADVVGQAMSEATTAYSALESGSEDAAAELAAAYKKASDALNGIYSENTLTAHEQWALVQKGAGGGPGRAFDPPNIYDVPWETQSLRSFYQGLFGNLWGSSSFGGGRDRDATPE
jgi:hypothetical protein